MSDAEKTELLAQIDALKASQEELSKKLEEVSKVNAGSVSHLVKPHSDALRAAATSMCAAGIGNHSTDGHGAVLNRMADRMDAEAAVGKIPHIYRDHDFINGSANQAKVNDKESPEFSGAVKKLTDELDSIKTLVTDLKKDRFNAAAEPERKTLSPAITTLLAKGGIEPDKDSGKLDKHKVNEVMNAMNLSPVQKAQYIYEMDVAGKI